MPFIQIHLAKGKSAKYKKALSAGIHKAFCAVWQTSKEYAKHIGKFQTITEYSKDHFYVDKDFAGVKRSKNTVYIYITTIKYPAKQKKLFFKTLATTLEKNPGIKRNDLFVAIIGADKENFYVGGSFD